MNDANERMPAVEENWYCEACEEAVSDKNI